MAIKSKDWGPTEKPQGTALTDQDLYERLAVIKAKLEVDKPKQAPEVCYTQLPGDSLEVIPLAFPDNYGNERAWYVERWLANMALCAAAVASTAPYVTCIDVDGRQRLGGYLRAACMYDVPLLQIEGGRYAFRPEVMVAVSARQTGERNGRWWPLGLCLFEIAEGAGR